jgi:Domain of unknown function (DUF362)
VTAPMNRRVFGAAAIAGTGALAVQRMLSTGCLQDRRKPRSRVAVIHQEPHSDRLDQTLADGLRLFNLDLSGKTVLLKPNLVESIPGREVNTNPQLVGAAATAFLALGARTVLVGEGPGHQRDTMLVLAETGLETELRERRIKFVDLNRDEVVKLPLKTRFTGLEFLWLPRTVLVGDFIVSMPKVKTHHWAGVTLSMKICSESCRVSRTDGPRIRSTGGASIGVSSTSTLQFPLTLSSRMESLAWRATGYHMALHAISDGS